MMGVSDGCGGRGWGRGEGCCGKHAPGVQAQQDHRDGRGHCWVHQRGATHLRGNLHHSDSSHRLHRGAGLRLGTHETHQLPISGMGNRRGVNLARRCSDSSCPSLCHTCCGLWNDRGRARVLRNWAVLQPVRVLAQLAGVFTGVQSEERLRADGIRRAGCCRRQPPEHTPVSRLPPPGPWTQPRCAWWLPWPQRPRCETCSSTHRQTHSPGTEDKCCPCQPYPYIHR
jgi:hypothetical protein